MSGGGAPAGPGERLRRGDRLRKRGEYLRCYRRGRRRHGALVTLYFLAGQAAAPRVGITVSRKVGGAATRYRIKRRLKEIYRRWSERSSLPALDLVLHVKPAASGASFEELRREVQGLMRPLLRR